MVGYVPTTLYLKRGRELIKDITNQRFGRLVALERVGKSKNGKSLWLCQCDCGRQKTIKIDNLTSGHTTSCGCYSVELITKRSRTHGERNTKLYNVWYGIKNRCFRQNYQNYKDYGGRGITLCNEWKDFSNFSKWAKENGYQEGLTIERIDVNGNYCPKNCTWIPHDAQARNKRNNVFITYNGERHCVSEWSRLMNIKRQTLEYRLKNGWNIERAFNTPVR